MRNLSISLPAERYRHLLAVICVLIIAAFLRTYQLTEYPPGLWLDEALNGNDALEAIQTGDYKVFYADPENNGQEGLFINIQALFLSFFGKREPWVLRLPSAIFGIFTVLGVYLLGRELFGKKVGLLAAFLVATSFWHLIFSRIGFRATSAPFYVSWGLWLLLVTLRIKRLHFSLPLSLLAGLVFGLGFHTYIAYRVMPVLVILVFFFTWFYYRTERKRSHSWPTLAVLFWVGFMIAVAPLVIHFINVPRDFSGRMSQVSLANSKHPVRDLWNNTVKTIGMFHFVGDLNWRHNHPRHPELVWPVGIFFVAGLYLGIRRLRAFSSRSFNLANHSNSNEAFMGDDQRDKNRPGFFRRLREASNRHAEGRAEGYLLCLIWIAVAATPAIFSSDGLPHALRSILMIPPVFMLSACGAMFLYETVRDELHLNTARRWLGVAAFAILCALLIQVFIAYFHRWGPNQNTRDAFTETHLKLARQLLALPPEVKKYVIVKGDGFETRGYPFATQTVMFITDTFLPEGRREKNIYYVRPENIDTIPADAQVFILE